MTKRGLYVLACPFCGQLPETLGSGEQQRGLMIHCITPGCVNPSVSYYDHATAARAWNRRIDGAGMLVDRGPGEEAPAAKEG